MDMILSVQREIFVDYSKRIQAESLFSHSSYFRCRHNLALMHTCKNFRHNIQQVSKSIAFVLFISCSVSFCNGLHAQNKSTSLSFIISMQSPANHLYHVVFNCSGIKQDSIEFKMPQWTPGYYQIMNFANNVQNFTATDASGKNIGWAKGAINSWKVNAAKSTVVISYDVKTTRPFVATSYLDEERGYISPAGVFIYPSGMIKNRVTVTVEPYGKWSTVATGLEAVKGKKNVFTAKDYDVLFDSPILMGNLESLPSFSVKGIPHFFEAYKPGEFDRNLFMSDMQKIVATASGIIGDIPYDHYTFLSIGPGAGGIEHLNSASVSFSGDALKTKEGKIRVYNFLAHEYFHHYNVKRIRPIELGPFDYDNGSRTKMLWLSEGITVYYEYMVVKRAGFVDANEILQTFQTSIKDYESKPGRQFQTPAEASYSTWEEGPFGRTGDDVNKTISPYDKGPLLGMLLDFKIRHETKNKRSLDDLMRLLYNKYYKQKSRGFTEDEFRKEAEMIAGTSLNDFFDYIYTLKQVDYPTYLSYAGLNIDTTAHEVAGGWLGISTRDRNDSLIVSNVEWLSPAWNAGFRRRNVILEINGVKTNAKSFEQLLTSLKPGDKIKINSSWANGIIESEIILGTKLEHNYNIKPAANPDKLQTSILKSWMGE